MLDMDGTLLDLAFDNHVWVDLVPRRYAEHHGVALNRATDLVFAKLRAARGELNWYCLDHWSEQLDIDIVQLHHDVSHRIGYLPGALNFLRSVCASDSSVLLVTNSHPSTLALKDAVTGLCDYVDGVYTSHQYGHAKETQEFWRALQDDVGFDAAHCTFIDDSYDVLKSAACFGIKSLFQVTHPDTVGTANPARSFTAIERVADVLATSRTAAPGTTATAPT